MASFEKVKDVHGWLAAFEPKATKSKVDFLGRLFSFEYKVPEEGFLVSDSRTVGGVEKGCFYLIAFAYGLRFPLSDFIVKVLRVYNVVPSQLHLNC